MVVCVPNAVRRVVRRIRRPVLRRLRRHGLILMYHRIAEARHDPWSLCVAPSNFRAHLDILRRNADVVPLEQFTQRLQTSRGRRPTVAITFDDGYLDNCTSALPLLQEADAAATFFLSTGWIGRRGPFWWDLLSELVLAGTLPRPIELRIGETVFAWSPDRGEVERNSLHVALWSRLQVAGEDERAAALRELCRISGFDPAQLGDARPMTPDEVRRVQAAGLVELAAHTVNHRPLSKLPVAEQRREIEGSRRECEELMGRLPTSFAYPYGDFDAGVREVVAQCGFSQACTTHQELAWEGDDPLLLPRVEARNIAGEAFERELLTKWLR